MNILVTGSDGFVGRNLVWNLKEIQGGKNRTRPGLAVSEIYGYDKGSTSEELENACRQVDFVFHLAGVNRPKENHEFMEGNFGFAGMLLDTLKKYGNPCPVMLSAHREENIDTEANFTSLFNAVNRMAEKYDMPILYSCHPRSRKRLEESGFKFDSRVIAHEPLGFHDYNCLQMYSFCCVSDSGTLPEERSFFHFIGHPSPQYASGRVRNARRPILIANFAQVTDYMLISFINFVDTLSKSRTLRSA